MKRILLALTIIFSSLILSGCLDHGDAYLIKCNNTYYHVSSKDFKASVNREYREKYLNNDKTARFELRKELAQKRVKTTTQTCISNSFNYEPTEAEIQKDIEKIYKKYGSKENFENEVLKRHGITEETIYQQHKYNLKQKKLIEITGVAKIPDKEIQEFYKNHIYDYTTPKKTYIHDILIKTNFATIKREIIEDDKQNKMIAAQVDDLARKKQTENEHLITELKEKLKQNPKNFPNLAKIYSQDKENAKSGGEFILEEVNSKYPREFIETIEKLKVGQISEPTRSQYGTHFLYKREIVPKKIQPLSEVKEDIKEKIVENDFPKYLKLATDEYAKNHVKYSVIYTDKTLDPNYKLPKNPIKRFFVMFGK